VPTPTKMFSPPQENLLALYQHLAVDVLLQPLLQLLTRRKLSAGSHHPFPLFLFWAVQVPVQGPRNLVIYTSREGSWSRDVANERFIIDAMRTLLAKTGTCSIVYFLLGVLVLKHLPFVPADRSGVGGL